MKHLFLTTVAILLANLLFGQVPQAFNYQGAARTAAGAPIANSTIAIRASVLDGSVAGTVVYSERNVTTTSGSGIFSIGIGNGTPISGTFGSINWSTGNKFLKIDLDAAGGTNYVTLGTTQFLSVPFAQYAASAGQSVQQVLTVTGSLASATDEFGTQLSDKSGFEVSLIGSNPLIKSTTNPTGSFSLNGVPSGTYNLLFSKPGFIPYTLSSQSFVAGGLSTISVNGPEIYGLSSTLPQNISATTGTYSYNTDYNIIKVSGSISPAGTPSVPRFLAFYYSTTPGINGTSNGKVINLSPVDGINPMGTLNPITSSSFDFGQLVNQIPVPSGNTIYIKAYGQSGNANINFDNASNETSIVLPSRFVNYAFTSFNITTTAGTISNQWQNLVNVAFTVTPAPNKPMGVQVYLYLSTQPIPSNFQNIPASGAVSFNTNSLGEFAQSSSPNNFIMRGYPSDIQYYVRGYIVYPDGSINYANPSPEVSFVLPKPNNTPASGPGNSCMSNANCPMGKTCIMGTCQ